MFQKRGPLSVAPTEIQESRMSPTTAVAAQAPDRQALAADPAAHWPITVIEKQAGWALFDLRELWRYRELLVFLTWRDIKVRYKQTVLGAAWAVLQPVATMTVFSLFVGKLPGIVPPDMPYPLFILIGLVAWNLFAGA